MQATAYGFWITATIGSIVAGSTFILTVAVVAVAWHLQWCSVNGVSALLISMVLFTYCWGLGIVGMGVAVVGAVIGWVIGYVRLPMQLALQGALFAVGLKAMYWWSLTGNMQNVLAGGFAAIGGTIGLWYLATSRVAPARPAERGSEVTFQ